MERMKNKILNLIKSAVWFVLCLLVGALIFEGIRSLANSDKPAKRVGISVITEEEHDYLVVDTKHGVCVIHAESCPCNKKKAKSNPMIDKNFVLALTEVLRYFRDNGELKKAYEIQKDSLADVANSEWGKALNGFLTSKVKEDGIDAELPDIDNLIKKLTSDEFIEKKIKDILGE